MRRISEEIFKIFNKYFKILFFILLKLEYCLILIGSYLDSFVGIEFILYMRMFLVR